ncbi:hypothetical protein BKA64DRAFT_352362 [Cadophora sp. MPI-SDFR-AT-0126]|nr:hypothetical protein BKA64DRAFT_352362 [Leotiomycetes sp. MPI-SDFR-AT-0126]
MLKLLFYFCTGISAPHILFCCHTKLSHTAWPFKSMSYQAKYPLYHSPDLHRLAHKLSGSPTVDPVSQHHIIYCMKSSTMTASPKSKQGVERLMVVLLGYKIRLLKFCHLPRAKDSSDRIWRAVVGDGGRRVEECGLEREEDGKRDVRTDREDDVSTPTAGRTAQSNNEIDVESYCLRRKVQDKGMGEQVLELLSPSSAQVEQCITKSEQWDCTVGPKSTMIVLIRDGTRGL